MEIGTMRTLLELIASSEFGQFKAIIDKMQTITETDYFWGEILISVCRQNRIKTLECLIDKGIDIHYQNDLPIKTACIYLSLDIVKFLIDNKYVDIFTNDNIIIKTINMFEKETIEKINFQNSGRGLSGTSGTSGWSGTSGFSGSSGSPGLNAPPPNSYERYREMLNKHYVPHPSVVISTNKQNNIKTSKEIIDNIEIQRVCAQSLDQSSISKNEIFYDTMSRILYLNNKKIYSGSEKDDGSTFGWMSNSTTLEKIKEIKIILSDQALKLDPSSSGYSEFVLEQMVSL